MNAEISFALWSLALATISALTLVVKLVAQRLERQLGQIAENTNGKLQSLMDENLRLRLEIEQLYAIIHSQAE